MVNVIHTTDGLNWHVDDATVRTITSQTGSEWYYIPAPGFDIGIQAQSALYGRYYHSRQIAYIEVNRNDT